jgi:hypothetical protein
MYRCGHDAIYYLAAAPVLLAVLIVRVHPEVLRGQGLPDALLDALNNLKMTYPQTTAKRRRQLKSVRKLLVK